MTAKKNLVKSMLMSILTAGIYGFAFAFTACSDDELANANSMEDGSDKIGNYADFEPYGLTYHNFDNADDVQILNADTTEIAVRKSLADKLGITNFENHPLGIWDDPSHLAYGRKALEQKLEGDTYIIKVEGVTAAELIGEKSAQLVTDWYVNEDETLVATRAAYDNIPEYAAKYVDDDGLIHPAVVQYTDPYGYDKDYYVPGIDEPSAEQTRAAQSGEYQYVTAEEMVSGTRGSIHPRLISFHNKITFDKNIPLGKDSKDSINIEGKIPVDFELNYFLTIDGGIKWKWFIPYPALKKFETGVDGEFGFHPNATIGFRGKCSLPKDLQKITLAKFKGFTYTFMIGVVPVTVTIDPALKLKLDGSVTAKASLGFSYDYSNKFKAGIRWQGSWSTIKEFEELENKFTFARPQVSFGAKAGIGLFMTATTKIYGVMGPELGIGPGLGAEANVTVSPEDVDWKAEVKMTVQAWAGAKIEILGWKLAEWSTTFDIVGPWTLLKLPSDGNEHKTPAEQKAEDVKKQRENKINNYATMIDNFREKLENMVIKYMEMDGGEHDEKVDLVLNFLDAQYNSCKDAGRLANYFKKNYDNINTRYEQFCADNNWKDIVESIKGSEAYNIYDTVLEKWGTNINFDNIRKDFVKTHGREPKIQEQEDMKYLMTKVMDYSKDYYYAHEADYKNAYDYLMSYGQKWFKKSSMELHQSIAYETIRYYTQVWKQKIDASYVFSSEKMGLTYEMERFFQAHVYKFEKILEERDELMKKWDSQ